MLDTNWWNQLESQWKNAFGLAVFRHLNVPSAAELEELYLSSVLRLAGPMAPYPNMSFELTNLSGISRLHNLEILVVAHQKIKRNEILQSLKALKSLFLFNNEIESLKGIEELKYLEQLYVQYNKIDTIGPVKQLTGLKEMYINNNLLTSLDGLTERHSENLHVFFCKPNDRLAQKEIIHVENRLGIRCRGL